MSKESTLARIEILGLHGDRNVTLNFTHPWKILVDENGAGKTTVLNMLADLLQHRPYRLNRYQFDKINLSFSNDTLLSFDRPEFPMFFGRDAHPVLREIAARFPPAVIEGLVRNVQRLPFSRARMQTNLLDLLAAQTGAPPELIYDLVRQQRIIPTGRTGRQLQLFDGEGGITEEISSKLEAIQELFPYQILYFPTYRLVEEDLPSLGISQERSESWELIQFGMGVVADRWNETTDDIRRSSVQWFSRISGSMLDELTDGIQREKIDYDALERSRDALRIVLGRVGDNILPPKKERIVELVGSGDIRESQHEPLAYFLSRLVKIYEQQGVWDKAIKSFVEVVNGYFADKEIRYDESELEIQAFNKRSQTELSLDRLSAGEKQIVSIFTRLYFNFDHPEPFAILFDEPELSLSMEWQKKLLQDIVDSGQCAFLLAATHSPFIFENDLAQFADVLDIRFIESANEPS